MFPPPSSLAGGLKDEINLSELPDDLKAAQITMNQKQEEEASDKFTRF